MLALDNGDMKDLDPYRADRVRAFNGRGIAYLRGLEPGSLTIHVSSAGLRGADRTLVVRLGVTQPVVSPAAAWWR